MLVIGGKEVFTTLEELVNPNHTVLLLIDLQNDFIMPGGYLDKSGSDTSTLQEIVGRVRRILEEARRCGVMIVHVQMTLYPKFLIKSPASLHELLLLTGCIESNAVEQLPQVCIEGTWGWQIVDELKPLPNEVVVKKHRSSAFIGTNLDMILRSNGIKSVTMVGVVTNACVMATANDASFFDYYPILLRDCIASHKPELHEAATLIMSQAKDLVDSEDVLKVWTCGKIC